MFVYKKKEKAIQNLNKYIVKYEDSIQEILSENPQVLLSNNELNIAPHDRIVAFREYQTSRGPIDIVYITDNEVV